MFIVFLQQIVMYFTTENRAFFSANSAISSNSHFLIKKLIIYVWISLDLCRIMSLIILCKKTCTATKNLVFVIFQKYFSEIVKNHTFLHIFIDFTPKWVNLYTCNWCLLILQAITYKHFLYCNMIELNTFEP